MDKLHHTAACTLLLTAPLWASGYNITTLAQELTDTGGLVPMTILFAIGAAFFLGLVFLAEMVRDVVLTRRAREVSGRLQRRRSKIAFEDLGPADATAEWLCAEPDATAEWVWDEPDATAEWLCRETVAA